MVAERMRSTCMDDMSKMGLEVISFTIREVRDKNEYITNMGRPDVARINRDAEIAAAEAERDTAIRRAIALREAAVAKSSADQERVIAETASLAKQAEAQRDLDIQKAQFTEAARRQEAQADKAYELQTNVMQQKVVAEQVKIQQIEKQDRSRCRRPRSSSREGTHRHRPQGSRDRASAHRKHRQRRKISHHHGSRRPRRSNKAAGRSRSQYHLPEGRAEAKAMNVKAEAYQEWTQAAVVDKLITNMADIVRAMAEPLGKVDKITIVSTGNDGSTGASKITGEMTKIAAQVPALFEALSGMDLHDLMANVKAMKPREGRPTAQPCRHNANKGVLAAVFAVILNEAKNPRFCSCSFCLSSRRDLLLLFAFVFVFAVILTLSAAEGEETPHFRGERSDPSTIAPHSPQQRGPEQHESRRKFVTGKITCSI